MMAILHVVSKHLNQDGLRNLVERSGQSDAYIFMDDGVYVLLSPDFKALVNAMDNTVRPIYIMTKDARERGIMNNNYHQVRLINMADLVRLTSTYTSSISW